jgi:DNA primase
LHFLIRIAELAQVTDEEMQSLLKLPSTVKTTARSMQRKSRSPLSIKKHFILMALMRPDLVLAEDSAMLGDTAEEDVFLKKVLNACIQQPTYKPAVLLRMLQGEVNLGLMHEIEQALHNLDESLNIELDFIGARTQLTEAFKDSQDAKLLGALKEKPLSELSDEDREMLKRLTVK